MTGKDTKDAKGEEGREAVAAAGEIVVRRGTAVGVLVPATDELLAEVVANLRDEDRREHEHAARFVGEEYADTRASLFEKCWIMLLDGETVGYVGLLTDPLSSPLSESRWIALLSTEAAGRHATDYVRLTRPVLRRVAEEAPPWVTDFYSMPLKSYAASVRWHEKTMGWRRVREIPLWEGETGVLFNKKRKEM